MQEILTQYWGLILIAAWFGYKTWNSRKVVAMLPALMQRSAVLLDVRSSAEYAQGSAPGSRNIPLHDLHRRIKEIPVHTPIVVCCASMASMRYTT